MFHIAAHAVMITGFVFMMMLVIEYLNVITNGVWQSALRGSRWRQYLLASFLGATPGCLGAFAVVSLYLHREVTLGALVAAMIATSGDESFVMLSMIPGQAFLIFIMLLFIGLAAGFVTDALLGEKTDAQALNHDTFDIHEGNICHCFPLWKLRSQWIHCSPARGIMVITLAMFLFAVVCGQLGPTEWNWLILACLVGLIPESGPHLLFLTLFVEGASPVP